MASINELIQRIDNQELRNKIQAEVNKLFKQKKFGLVYEEHLPECTPLYDMPIKIGTKVAMKTGYVNDIYTVTALNGDEVTCVKRVGEEVEIFNINNLVAIAEFGEPIYPTLKMIDTVENAPGSDLWHTLIEADNYHALQLLEYLYAGKIDCIYIDPPYNTGAKDWKYNNDYVDGSDQYRHSKWLSFMEKRLKLAGKLLNPKDSVLIVTIDEKEYLHLGCLLEDLFPEARMQMVSDVVNPSGVARDKAFFRTDEYIFFLKFGDSSPASTILPSEWITAKKTGKDSLRWRPIRRQGADDSRQDAYNQFYPIFLTADGKKFAGVGEALPPNLSWRDFVEPADKITIWPLKPDGTEGRWQISQDSFLSLWRRGYTKISYTERWGYVLKYIAEGEREKVERGQFPILGYNEDGSIITDNAAEESPFIPGTQWRIPSHSARDFGSTYINKILCGKRFQYPKSLYATHDAIRFFVTNKPNAIILDFFAGSGTTLHSVNLLNAEDGGHRRCIIVTNNEVSADEARRLKAQGYKPGDEAWENLGIAYNVAWPRTVFSIKGQDINGRPLRGKYIGSNIPMADGFESNVAFFKICFLNKTAVALGRQFKELLPVLWMKAGAVGKCPTLGNENAVPSFLILPDNKMAILTKESEWIDFDKDLSKIDTIKTVYIVTDSEIAYRSMTKDYGEKECYQIYRDYLDNFRINIGR